MTFGEFKLAKNPNRIQIKYKKKSFCGNPLTEELDELIDSLLEAGFQIDESYFDHIRENNGGVPLTKYFPSGEIERMLNFSDSYSTEGARYAEFNVNVVRNWVKDRVPENIVPFASMPHGAFLCFKYSSDHRPTVVMWNNELYEEEYVTIADSFDDFANLLQEVPFE